MALFIANIQTRVHGPEPDDHVETYASPLTSLSTLTSLFHPLNQRSDPEPQPDRALQLQRPLA